MPVNVVSDYALSNPYQVATGYIRQAGIEGDTSIYAATDILADILPSMSAQISIISAMWAVAVRITDYNKTLISAFEGYPTRYKFGSYLHKDGNISSGHGYLNYIEQWLPTQICQLKPFVPAGLDFDPPALAPSPVVVEAIVPILANRYHSGAIDTPEFFNKPSLGMYGNGQLILSLEKSVKATIMIRYYAQGRAKWANNYAYIAL